MATIEKRAGRAKPYRVRYRGPDGKQRSESFRTRVQADKQKSLVESDLIRGSWTDPSHGETSFDEWARRWLKTVIHLKPKTHAGYESLLTWHLSPVFGDYPLKAIDPIMVREWVADKHEAGLSSSRLRQAYQLLASIFAAAVQARYIQNTPCVGIKLPKTLPREMFFLTPVEVAYLAQTVRSVYLENNPAGDESEKDQIHKRAAAYEDLVWTLAYEGIRWGEAAALRRARVDIPRGCMDITQSLAVVKRTRHFGPTKGYRSRSLIIPDFLRTRLALHLAERVAPDPDAFVFAAADDGPMDHSYFRRNVWLPAVEAAGLPKGFRIHDLRHTSAAMLISQGAHPKMIQDHLGHSSIKVTLDLYGHLYPKDKERVAEGMNAAWVASMAELGEHAKQQRTKVVEFRSPQTERMSGAGGNDEH